jgi:hypothetical protein
MRRHPCQMGRALRGLRCLEHHRRGGTARERTRRPHAGRLARPQGRPQRSRRRGSRAAARRERHRRVRPRARRRARPGLGGARRRRSRHRQVDAAPAGGGRLRARRRRRRLRLGRGGGGPDPPARRRLGLSGAPLRLAAETNLRDILTTLEAERPRLAVIDSIQTMWVDHVDSAPGSVAQVRAAAHELVTSSPSGAARR